MSCRIERKDTYKGYVLFFPFLFPGYFCKLSVNPYFLTA